MSTIDPKIIAERAKLLAATPSPVTAFPANVPKIEEKPKSLPVGITPLSTANPLPPNPFNLPDLTSTSKDVENTQKTEFQSMAPVIEKPKIVLGDGFQTRFAKVMGLSNEDANNQQKLKNEFLSMIMIVAIIPLLSAMIDMLQGWVITNVWDTQTLMMVFSFAIAPSALAIVRKMYSKEAADLKVELEQEKNAHRSDLIEAREEMFKKEMDMKEEIAKRDLNNALLEKELELRMYKNPVSTITK